MRNIIVIMTSTAALFTAGAAVAAEHMSDLQYLNAARCRGLAVSEGLGKVDTANIDRLLREETGSRELPVRSSAAKKMKAATAAGDKATGEARAKLIAERDADCGKYFEAVTQIASN